MSEPQPTQTPEVEAEGTRFRRLLANTSIYALGELGLRFLTAIFTPLLTYYLAPAELGVWSLALMLFVGFSTVCGLGLHGAITRFYYDHEFDEPARRQFQGTTLSFLLLWSLTLCLGMTWLGPALFDIAFTDLAFWPYGAFVVWMSFISIIGLVPRAIWAAAERSRLFVSINVLGSVTNLVGSLGLVMFTGLGVLGLFWGRTASLLVLAIPFTIYSVRRVGLAWDSSDLRSALAFSLPLVPHLLAHWVLGMSDRFLIDHHYGSEGQLGPNGLSAGLSAVGIYGTAYVFINMVNMIAVSMNRAFVPQFTRAYEDENQRPFVARSITYFLLAVSGTSVALAVLSPPLILAVFNERYAAAAEFAPILALGGMFQGIYYIYVAGLFYFKKNMLIPVVTIVSGTVNVALNILWLPEYGLVGAAWATLIGYMVLALGVRWGCRRYTQLPFERARVAWLVVILVLVGGLATLLDGLLPLWWELAAKGCLLACTPIFLHLVGFWREDELAWLKNRLGLSR
jgi:O-antigen/teichoic acid export membrane protein